MPRFSVIAPAHQVQAYLHACLEPVLFRRTVGRFATVGARHGRLSRGCRVALRRARTYYRRCRTTGVPAPPRSRLRQALVRLGPHRTVRVLRRVTALRRRAAKVTAKSLRALRAALLRLRHRFRPRPQRRADVAVFAAYGARSHDGVNRPSCAAPR
ncbi:hypothetical protein ABZT08_20085 [Streptomyces sp. NPDC005526]|uniref:hypothetical protein n=1 Tax=Streptomyces sp. NPDC005526 TaxID=3156885 RepID=UPI0033A1CDED